MLDQEGQEYRYLGDLMQSEASRLLEWVEKHDDAQDNDTLPYEVRMAMVGLKDAIEQWTHARAGYATASTATRGDESA